MKEIKVKLTVDAGNAKKEIDNVTKSTKKLDKANSNASKSNNSLSASTAKTGVAMGGVATASTTAAGGLTAVGGAVGTAAVGFEGLKLKLQSVIVSLKSVKVAMMATGIGIVIVLLASLKAAFTRSEEGQNKFAKAMAALGAVTDVLMDGLASLGDLLIRVFTEPQKVLEDFSKAVKEYVTDQITLITDGLGLLGSAIKKAFSGDISGALDDAAEGANKLLVQTNPLVQATEALAGATKDLVAEMTEEARIAGAIADQRAAADKLDRALITDRAEANRKRAELLDKAVNKELFSAKERIAFLTEAGELEDEITNKEIAAARLRLEAKTAENALGLSNKQALDEEANLKAKLIDLETAKLRKAKLVTSQISALNKEAAADQKAIDTKAAEDAKKIADFSANTKEEKRQVEREKLKTQLEELLKIAGDDNEAKIELQKSFDEKMLALKTKHGEEDAKAQKVIDDKAKAKKKIADDKKLKEEQALADAKLGIQKASLDAASSAVGILAGFAEENKELQAASIVASNAIGIATNIIDTNAANAKLTLEAGVAAPALITANFIRMGTGIAASIAATAQGLAALGKGGDSSAGGAGATGGAEAPAFNLVEGSESNAIQQSIQGQENAVKAYVVSGDVTTAQSADRRIVEGSGF